MGLSRLGMTPNPGHTSDPMGIISLGDQLRPFSDPIHLVEPVSRSPSGYFKPLVNLELHGQRGAPPPRATLAIGTLCGLASCPQRTPAPGAHASGPYQRRDWAVWVDRNASDPSGIEAYDPVDTGARAKQEGGNLGRMAASSTQPSHVQREKSAIPRLAQGGDPLGLF
jgi:hypothetical protein